MEFNKPSKRVLAVDEKYGVPMSIYWTTEELADWICEIGYPQYRECIEANNVAGRHLICLDVSRLTELGITDFDHLKDIAAKIREMIKLDHIIQSMIISMSNPRIAYMETKRKTGELAMNLSYEDFLKKYKRWYKF